MTSQGRVDVTPEEARLFFVAGPDAGRLDRWISRAGLHPVLPSLIQSRNRSGKPRRISPAGWLDDHVDVGADQKAAQHSHLVVRTTCAHVRGVPPSSITIAVDEYDTAIEFFVDVLRLELIEDSPSVTNDGRLQTLGPHAPDGCRDRDPTGLR